MRTLQKRLIFLGAIVFVYNVGLIVHEVGHSVTAAA